MPLVSRYSAWIKMVLRSKRPWNQLSTDEQSALAPKLAGLGNATAADAFNKVINAGASDAIRVTASVQTVKCYIAQSGGLENSETWQQIKEITEVNSNGGYPRGADMGEIIGNAVDPFENQTSCIQVRVNDKDEFLKALANDPKNAFQVDSLGDEAMKTIGASWHPFNNARAATDYRSDPQMHYSNDWSDKDGYGPHYFFFHWDHTSSNGRMSTWLGDVRGGMAHGPCAPVSAVMEYLKRTGQMRK